VRRRYGEGSLVLEAIGALRDVAAAHFESEDRLFSAFLAARRYIEKAPPA